jgi:hypothetical protein
VFGNEESLAVVWVLEIVCFRHRVGPRHVSANYMPKDFADNSATQKRIALSISVFKRPAPLSSNSS